MEDHKSDHKSTSPQVHKPSIQVPQHQASKTQEAGVHQHQASKTKEARPRKREFINTKEARPRKQDQESGSSSTPSKQDQGSKTKKAGVHQHQASKTKKAGVHQHQASKTKQARPRLLDVWDHVRTKVRNLQIYRTGYCTVLYCKLLTFLFEQLEKKRDHFCILNPIQGVHL